MPRSIKIDIWRESHYTRGVSTNRYDRALRYGLATGLVPPSASGNSVNDVELQYVTDAFIAQYGLFHKLNRTLPLAYITVKRWGPTKAWVYAYYLRRNASLNHPTNAFANTATGTYATEWWREGVSPNDGLPLLDNNGLPMGRIRGLVNETTAVSTDQPRSYIITLPTVEVYVPFELSYNPILGGSSPMFDLCDKININQFDLYGVAINPYRARFNGAPCRGEYNPSTGLTTFKGGYSYSLCSQGFFRQGVHFGTGFGGVFPTQPTTGITTPAWRTQIGPAFPLATFPNSPATNG